MQSGAIIYFWIHFDQSAKDIMFQQCKSLLGANFTVAAEIFDVAFDFSPFNTTAVVPTNSPTQSSNATTIPPIPSEAPTAAATTPTGAV